VQLVILAKCAGLVQIIVMRVLPKTCAVAAPLLLLLSLGCQASSDGAHPGSSSGGSGGGGGGTLNLAGGVALPPGTQAAALLPARIRRLADAEYQASVTALVPDAAAGITADFIPDSRQSGFTLNEAQRVDPVFAGQLASAATTLAAAVRKNPPASAICTNPTTDSDACADKFIRTFGADAYRRPLADAEVTHLMTVFHVAYQGGSYEEGIELTVRAMLQSAAFLYLTEIGAEPATTIKLTPYELASQISYLIQGRPPSALLKQMAVDGKLDTPEGRAAATTDPDLGLFLLDDQASNAQTRAVMVVKEWLGTDKISDIAKDTNIYPDFAGAKAALGDETTQFLSSVVSHGGDGGSLAELLAGGWSMLNAPLAKVYGVAAPGADDKKFVRVDMPGRLGILNQGAFLSVFAHAHETAPVLRGVAVMRRVACDEVGDPVGLGTAVVPPLPDPSKTTRERFSVHGSSSCAVCHSRIDNYGFAFEAFDGMGEVRPGNTDNGKPVDSKVVIAGTDFDGSYADSNALVKAMSTSKQVRDCFARHIFRALATTSAPELKPSEDDFVKYWATTLEPDGSGKLDAKIVGTLTAFLTNPSFAYRRAGQ
jgi:Protein of unknown function (DUF1588)/Protein of unknown function (DUF1592)/Protein of unknown function (DUF1595)/Protein of unknown function (DUF1587)